MPIETASYLVRGRWMSRWKLLILSVICEGLIVEILFSEKSYLTGAITILALTLPMLLAVSVEPVIGILTALAGAIFFAPELLSLPGLSQTVEEIDFILIITAWLALTSVVAVLVQREHRQRDALLAALIEAEQKERLAEQRERRRIANDLHDDTIQVIAGAMIKLDHVRKRMPPIPEYDQALASLREASDRTRRMMFELRPPEHGKLKMTLEAICAELRRETGIDTRVAIETEEMSEEAELICHRIILEAVNNVRKHAQAATIDISVRKSEEESLLCSVEDDGVGFDLTAHTHDRHLHLGIDACQERLRSIGGHYLVVSKPGRGTRVVFDIPLRR